MSTESKYEHEAQGFYWFAKGVLKSGGSKVQASVLKAEIRRIEALRDKKNPRDKV